MPREAHLKPGIPTRPEHLSEEACAEWDRVIAELFPAGLISKADRALLSIYCQTWSDWVDCCKLSATVEGQDRKLIKVAGNGKAFVTNPYFYHARKLADQLLRYIQELALSQSARSRVNSMEQHAEEESPASWNKFGS